MVTLADSLVASSSRPLSLHVRSDLTARRQRYQGRTYWVVKEPIGLRYFRFQEEEYAVLQMMQKGVSLEEIKEKFENEFAPHKITYQDLQQFIGTLHRSGLVVSDAQGQGKQLKKRRDERKRKEMLGRMSNVLAIRFKGIDPDWLLVRLLPWTRWFFSQTVALLFVCLGLSALLLIAVQFDVFRSRLPAFQQFFGAKNWLYLGLTLAVTKVMHEFGHGLLCKKFGGECHEMGVMFLVLTPCLYCNVSDSWMLPSKWQRAAIGAGGIYVELVLASIATFVWWFSDPGTLNHLALRVMFICSVSTVLFNGNPLLRFDGYYIMADLVEIPNLRQKASKILQRVASKYCLGMELPEDPFLPQKNQAFFALYTVAAVVYRWFVFFSILFFLNKVFEPYGLKIIGQAIALMGLFGLVVQPIWKMGKFFHQPGRMDQVKWPRLYITLGITFSVLALILLIPYPRNVSCTLQIEARDSVPVYIDVPGRLETISARPGDVVEKDQEIVRLNNPELQLQVDQLRAEKELYESELESLYITRVSDREAASEIGRVRAQVTAKTDELAAKLEDLARLSLKAPKRGTVLASQLMPERAVPDEQLPGWSGSPFDKKNHGMYLQIGEMPLCRVGNPTQLEAILAIDQADIDFVEKGDPVKIKMDSIPWDTIHGEVREKARREILVAPTSMANQAGGELATRTDASGAQVPISTTYQARVPFDDPTGQIRIGFRGRAKIRVGYQTLAYRAWRYLARTFHFYI